MAGRIGGAGESKEPIKYTPVTKGLTRFEQMKESFYTSAFYRTISHLFSNKTPKELATQDYTAFKERVFVPKQDVGGLKVMLQGLEKRIGSADIFELAELRTLLASIREDVKVLSLARGFFTKNTETDESEYLGYLKRAEALEKTLDIKIAGLTVERKAVFSAFQQLVKYCDDGKGNVDELSRLLGKLKEEKPAIYNQMIIKLKSQYSENEVSLARLQDICLIFEDMEPLVQEVLKDVESLKPTAKEKEIIASVIRFCFGQKMDQKQLMDFYKDLRQNNRPLFDKANFWIGNRLVAQKFKTVNQRYSNFVGSIELEVHKKEVSPILIQLVDFCSGRKVDKDQLIKNLISLKTQNPKVYNLLVLRLEQQYAGNKKSLELLKEVVDKADLGREKNELLKEVETLTTDPSARETFSMLIRYSFRDSVEQEKLVIRLVDLKRRSPDVFDRVLGHYNKKFMNFTFPQERFSSLLKTMEEAAQKNEANNVLSNAIVRFKGQNNEALAKKIMALGFGEKVDRNLLVQQLHKINPDERSALFKQILDAFPEVSENPLLLEAKSRILYLQARADDPKLHSTFLEIEELRFPGFEKTSGLPSLIKEAPSIFRDIIRGDSTIGKDNSAAKLLSPLVIHKDALKTLVDFWKKHPNQEKISGFSDIQVEAIKTVVGELEVASASQLQKLFQSNPFLFLTGPQLASFREHLHGIEQPPAISKQNEQILGLLVLQLPQLMLGYSELTPQQKVVVDALIETLQKKVSNSGSLDSFQTELVKFVPMIGRGVQDLRDNGFLEGLQMALRHPGRLQRPSLLFAVVADYANGTTETKNLETLISNLSVLKTYNPDLYKKSMDELIQRFSGLKAQKRILELKSHVILRPAEQKITDSKVHLGVMRTIEEEATHYAEAYQPRKVLTYLHQDVLRKTFGLRYKGIGDKSPEAGEEIEKDKSSEVIRIYDKIQQTLGDKNQEWLEPTQILLTQGSVNPVVSAVLAGLSTFRGVLKVGDLMPERSDELVDLHIDKDSQGVVTKVTVFIYADIILREYTESGFKEKEGPLKIKVPVVLIKNGDGNFEVQSIEAKDIDVSERPLVKDLPDDLSKLTA